MTKSSRKLLSGALAVVAAVTLVVMGTPRAWSGEHREETVALKSGSGVRHSPRWFQTTRSNGHPVGCGATAWAIAFGYWAQHKGKTRLFDFDVSTHFGQSSETDPALAPVMQEIADEMGTTYPEWNGKKYGRTLAGNMCKGLEYARKRGYHTRCFRIRGSEFEKYEIVKHWIENDKPAILLNNDPAKAFTTLHYPVIEGARKRQERSAGAWRDRDVEYLVNWGAGNRDSEWISVRQVGVDTQKRYGSFSIFLFDISDQPLTQTDDVNEVICDEWCRGNPACVKCSKHVGCGVGYDRMRSWTSAGKNYYACSRRETRAEASASNRAACESWCAGHSNCDKCSETLGCGRDYRQLKSWIGRGDNWYACQKEPTRAEASAANQRACEAWCQAHSECAKCTRDADCGRHYRPIKSWRRGGDNWYACKHW